MTLAYTGFFPVRHIFSNDLGGTKMKKLISLLLVLAMALTLAACGGSNAPAATEATKADATMADAPAAASKTKISVFWYDESDVYLSSVRTALNKELDALGVTYDNQYAANDQAKQIDQIKTAIAGGSNLLVINQVTSGCRYR